MDIDTAKIFVGTALMVGVAVFSFVTVSSAMTEMLRDLRILPPGKAGDRDRHAH